MSKLKLLLNAIDNLKTPEQANALTKIVASAGALGMLAPDEAEAAPMYFRSRGKNIFGLKNPTRQEAESFTKEYGGARALHGDNTYVWPLYPPHEVAEEALNAYGSHRLIFEQPGELKFMQENLPNLFKGAGAVGVGASLYSPEAAQARQYQEMAEQQSLQEPFIDPTILLAGPARWGGGIGNMIADMAMKLMGNYQGNTESGI